MNVRPDLRMSKAAFVEWDAGEGQRCELVGGRVVMMARPSRAHGKIVMNLGAYLNARLDPKVWDVIMEFGLDTGPDTLRYPDIVVFPAGSSNNSRTTSTPVLLAEALSPTTAEIDFGDKAAEYLAIPSLLAYMVLSQHEPKAWLWSRAETSAPFASGPKRVSGVEDFIPIAGLQLDVPMADVYRGVAFD